MTTKRINPIMQYFEYSHLPPHLQAVSAELCDLAKKLESQLPENPETSAGLRKLLEAKDCFVRAALSKPKAEQTPEADTFTGAMVQPDNDVTAALRKLADEVYSFRSLVEDRSAKLTICELNGQTLNLDMARLCKIVLSKTSAAVDGFYVTNPRKVRFAPTKLTGTMPDLAEQIKIVMHTLLTCYPVHEIIVGLEYDKKDQPVEAGVYSFNVLCLGVLRT